MAKGERIHQEHLAAVQLFGKQVGKRAGFRCEWCEGNDDARLWEQHPEEEPSLDNIALLCRPCRELVGAKNPDPHRLRSVRNALWSDVPAVAEGVAAVLARSKEPWAREAIEESFINDGVKRKLLEGR